MRRVPHVDGERTHVVAPSVGTDALELRGQGATHRGPDLVEGVKLVEKSLRASLAKEGLTEIDTDGPFDPHVHEALLTQPSHASASGSILEVVQRGYRFGDRVVRPARVIVAE